MTQLSFPESAYEQQQHLARVTSAIGKAVLAFCRLHQTFHAAELQAHVSGECSTAPASADRVLRELRKRGLVSYRVLNRAESLYQITGVKD